MFPNLRAEMARNLVNGKQLALALNISHESISNKMNGRTEFTRQEMFAIKNEFFPKLSIDYLFKIEVEKL